MSGYQLRSTIAGTVAQVDVSAGQSVQASSASDVITVLGDEGHVLTTTLDLAKVKSVEAGQKATVTTSSGQKLSGEVQQVGLLNQSSTSTPSYTVVLSVSEPSSGSISEGSSASASIEVASRKDVLTVPTSAVTRNGSRATVVVLSGDATRTTQVEIGAVGSDLTEITRGLSKGDTVVLADLDQAVTSSSDTSTSQRARFGGSGGLSGAGGMGGGPDGFGGGAPAGS